MLGPSSDPEKGAGLDINVISAFAKVSAAGFLSGLFASGSSHLGTYVLPLAGLLALVTAILVLFELTRLEAAEVAVTQAAGTPALRKLAAQQSLGPR
jgi:hypothetical protein